MKLKQDDVWRKFGRLLETTHPMPYGWDRIHPNIIGHTMISNLLLRFLKQCKAVVGEKQRRGTSDE